LIQYPSVRDGSQLAAFDRNRCELEYNTNTTDTIQTVDAGITQTDAGIIRTDAGIAQTDAGMTQMDTNTRHDTDFGTDS
jgi:hypothetical protein